MAVLTYTVYERMDIRDRPVQRLLLHVLGASMHYSLNGTGRRWVNTGGSYDPVERDKNYRLK